MTPLIKNTNAYNIYYPKPVNALLIRKWLHSDLPLSIDLLSIISVIKSQPWSKIIKWEIPEKQFLSFKLCTGQSSKTKSLATPPHATWAGITSFSSFCMLYTQFIHWSLGSHLNYQNVLVLRYHSACVQVILILLNNGPKAQE